MVAIYRRKTKRKLVKGVIDGEPLTKKLFEIKKELKILDYLADGKVCTYKQLKALLPCDITFAVRNLLEAEVIVRTAKNRYRLAEVEVCPRRNW